MDLETMKRLRALEHQIQSNLYLKQQQQALQQYRQSFSPFVKPSLSSLFFDVFGEQRRPGPVPDPPELLEETSTKPLVGFRAWNVVCEEEVEQDATLGEIKYEQWSLQSPLQKVTWDGPVLRADGEPCSYDPHDRRWKSREDHCHGIYAHKEPVWRDFSEEASPWYTRKRSPRAMGRVELTGKVVVHETGFRAEMCRIVQLVLSPSLLNKEDIKEILSSRYDCPVSFNPEDL